MSELFATERRDRAAGYLITLVQREVLTFSEVMDLARLNHAYKRCWEKSKAGKTTP